MTIGNTNIDHEDLLEASGIVDDNSPTANMYGCEPCPKCKSKYRVVMAATPNTIDCDDCGYRQPVKENRNG